MLMFGVGYSQPRGTRISIQQCMGAALYSLKCPDMAKKSPKKLSSYFLGEKTLNLHKIVLQLCKLFWINLSHVSGPVRVITGLFPNSPVLLDAGLISLESKLIVL